MKATVNILLLIIALACTTKGMAQVFYNDAGAREKHFIYEVKQIDEFLERFNDDKDSFIRKTYESYKKKFNIQRKDLVGSLFNYETQLWDSTLINNFIGSVVNEQAPSFIHFNSPGWYAELICNFRFGDAILDIPLILRVDVDEKKQARWIITGARTSIEYPATATTELGKNPGMHFIHPASHGNNFINLSKILDDSSYLSSYFDEPFFKRPNAVVFYHALADGKLQITHIKSIRYHFTQIDGWIFTVEQFRRKALNSGWLINTLQAANADEKKAYLSKLIQE